MWEQEVNYVIQCNKKLWERNRLKGNIPVGVETTLRICLRRVFKAKPTDVAEVAAK